MIFQPIFDKLEREGQVIDTTRIPSIDAILAMAYVVSRERAADSTLRNPEILDLMVSRPNLGVLREAVERYAEGRFGVTFGTAQTMLTDYVSVQDGSVELRVLECPCDIGQHLAMLDLSDILYWESVGNPKRHVVWRIRE